MPVGDRTLVRDIRIRLTGVLLIALCAAVWMQVYRTAGELPANSPSLFEMALAAVAFMSFSLGSGLTLLGSQLFDEVEVSERWARRSSLR